MARASRSSGVLREGLAERAERLLGAFGLEDGEEDAQFRVAESVARLQIDAEPDAFLRLGEMALLGEGTAQHALGDGRGGDGFHADAQRPFGSGEVLALDGLQALRPVLEKPAPGAVGRVGESKQEDTADQQYPHNGLVQCGTSFRWRGGKSEDRIPGSTERTLPAAKCSPGSIRPIRPICPICVPFRQWELVPIGGFW